MYDVLYMDHTHRGKLVARGLARQAACEVARAEARRRRVGRMFLAGSDPDSSGDVVVIVESAQRAA